MVTRMVTSMKVLYFAKSGVNTPMSSPPFDVVMAETVSKGRNPRLLFPSTFLLCLGILSVPRYSINLLIPIPMGMSPNNEMKMDGNTKAISDPNALMIINTLIPKNWPLKT